MLVAISLFRGHKFAGAEIRSLLLCTSFLSARGIVLSQLFIRTSSSICTYLFDKLFKEFARIILSTRINSLISLYKSFKGFIEEVYTNGCGSTYK